MNKYHKQIIFAFISAIIIICTVPQGGDNFVFAFLLYGTICFFIIYGTAYLLDLLEIWENDMKTIADFMVLFLFIFVILKVLAHFYFVL
jgi:hypothetical protein